MWRGILHGNWAVVRTQGKKSSTIKITPDNSLERDTLELNTLYLLSLSKTTGFSSTKNKSFALPLIIRWTNGLSLKGHILWRKMLMAYKTLRTACLRAEHTYTCRFTFWAHANLAVWREGLLLLYLPLALGHKWFSFYQYIKLNIL